MVGRQIKELVHVSDLAFSPDGSLLAVRHGIPVSPRMPDSVRVAVGICDLSTGRLRTEMDSPVCVLESNRALI